MNAKLNALGGCSNRHLQGRGHTVAAPVQTAQLVLETVLEPRLRVTGHWSPGYWSTI